MNFAYRRRPRTTALIFTLLSLSSPLVRAKTTADYLRAMAENDSRKRAAASRIANEERERRAANFTLNSLNRTTTVNETVCPDAKPVALSRTRTPLARPYPEASSLLATAGFANAESTLMDMHAIAEDSSRFPKPTHEVSLTIVIGRGTGWDPAGVNSALAKVAAIYAQCGIRFRSITTTLADLPYRYNEVNETRIEAIARLMPRAFPKPTIYFTSKFIDENATLGGGAYACSQGSCGAAKGSIWFTRQVLNPPPTAANPHPGHYAAFEGDPLAIPIAHEIGHMLGLPEHVTGASPNVMQANSNLINESITAEQCEVFKTKTNFIHPIQR